MEQIKVTIAKPKIFYGFIIAAGTLALAALTAVMYPQFPRLEQTMAEAGTAEAAHRPALAWRNLRYHAKLNSCIPYLECLENGGNEAVFLSMFSLESFEEEDFLNYRGVSILKMEPVLDNSLELLGILELLLSGNALPERIYLGIDPIKLERHLSWEEDLDWKGTIAALICEHEEIQWEILLSYPSLAEWQQLPDAGRQQGIAAYGRAMDALYTQENQHLFYIGGQEWLICNQNNYAGEGMLNPSVTKTVMLRVFCDQRYMVTQDNCGMMLGELSETLDYWQHAPDCTGSLAGDTLVFLGDSVFGNYTDSASIPGVVENFTGAKCINCGYGGVCLAGESGNAAGVNIIEDLCNGRTGNIPEEIAAYSGIQELIRSGAGSGRLVFLLNYGINDYLVGHPMESEDKYARTTYSGAMRTAIEQLQTSYPGAEIVIVTPGYITFYDCGTYIASETGSSMKEYVEAATGIAREYGLAYMDIYEVLEKYIQEEDADVLLGDGVHPNERGRFLLGLLIGEKINDLLKYAG